MQGTLSMRIWGFASARILIIIIMVLSLHWESLYQERWSLYWDRIYITHYSIFLAKPLAHALLALLLYWPDQQSTELKLLRWIHIRPSISKTDYPHCFSNGATGVLHSAINIWYFVYITYLYYNNLFIGTNILVSGGNCHILLFCNVYFTGND